MAYKEAFARLRELKQEIEHLQMLLEQSRTKLQKDFEHWMTLMLRQQQAASAVTAGALTGGSPSASSMPNKPHRCGVTSFPHHTCFYYHSLLPVKLLVMGAIQRELSIKRSESGGRMGKSFCDLHRRT